MMKILNLKLVILVEYQHIKIFLQYTKFQIGCEEVFLIKTVKKKTVPWAYINGVLKGQEIAGKFHKKELQKQIKKSLELKK